MRLMIDVENVDFELLAKQKETLVEVIFDMGKGKYAEDLTGILHLLDDIQDQAATQIGEENVFGKLTDD